MPRIILLTLLLSTALIPAPAPPVLRAGVARADITPPPGVELWGYSNRKGPAT